jgi:hypothetical protein
MPVFDVTHVIGEQGYGEDEVVTAGVQAETALEAIYKVVPPESKRWTARCDNWDEAFLLNPAAPNRSEDYCDYYCAKLTGM